MPHLSSMINWVREITPIYGNGWVDAEGATRDVPEPFRLGCDTPNATEGIVLGEHEFSGATAYLSPRHATLDGVFNVEIRSGEVQLSYGYAEA
ncbi:hypothetical protein HL653_13075 [Sphingomonas sp. AP4-R1]|uniref:hypothetical protein n=1 Tax=Sphingomonas sp. AP4-R1 TaxID=2735134 RepID=UPI001493A017|nr:hypothetical protein [Sphingomonas sp. AP4-R1]QJU58570.1 hypothetical protein HL653_13075 [Sphingomonas sp. AP4-R1]